MKEDKVILKDESTNEKNILFKLESITNLNDKIKKKEKSENLLNLDKYISIHYNFIKNSFKKFKNIDIKTNNILNNFILIFKSLKYNLTKKKEIKKINDNDLIFNEKNVNENSIYKRIFYLWLSFNNHDLILNLKEFINIFDKNNKFALNFKEFSELIYFLENKIGSGPISTIFENLENFKFLKFKFFDRLYWNKKNNKTNFDIKILKIIFDSFKINTAFNLNEDKVEFFTNLKKFHSTLIMFYFLNFDNLITNKKIQYLQILGMNLNKDLSENNKKYNKSNNNSFYKIFKEVLHFEDIETEITLKEIDFALSIFQFYHNKELNFLNYNNLISYISLVLKNKKKKMSIKLILKELAFYFCLQKNCNDIIKNYSYEEIYENKFYSKILEENTIWNLIKFEDDFLFNKKEFTRKFMNFYQEKEIKLEIDISVFYLLYCDFIKTYFPLINKIVF